MKHVKSLAYLQKTVHDYQLKQHLIMDKDKPMNQAIQSMYFNKNVLTYIYLLDTW